jgi:hypothetical protein
MLRHKAVKEAVRVAFGISGITDEDEARDIAKNAAAFEKVRVEKAPKTEVIEVIAQNITVEKVEGEPVIALRETEQTILEGVEAWPDEIVQAEAAVNAFLLAKEQIAEGQTFRDIADESYRKRVLANTAKFLAAVNAAQVKEAA